MSGWERRRVGSADVTVPMERIVGKQRPRTDYRNHRTYTPKRTRDAEEAVRQAFRETCGERFAAFDGIVRLHVTVKRPLAKSNPKRWRGRADLGKPDWDNVGKLVCDALNGLAYKDDSQIEVGTVTKLPRVPHGEEPSVRIYVEYFTEEYAKE